MKKFKQKMSYTLYILLVAFMMISCIGNDIVQIETSEKPFVVDRIERYDDTHEIYVHEGWSSETLENFFSCYPKIKAPKGSFQMGDTVRINCN